MTKSLNVFKKGWYKFKGGLDYPVRMGIFMFMIAPFFDKILQKFASFLRQTDEIKT